MFYQISSTIYEQNHLLPLIDSKLTRVTEKGPIYSTFVNTAPIGFMFMKELLVNFDLRWIKC